MYLRYSSIVMAPMRKCLARGSGIVLSVAHDTNRRHKASKVRGNAGFQPYRFGPDRLGLPVHRLLLDWYGLLEGLA
jgi:hypothetical protein